MKRKASTRHHFAVESQTDDGPDLSTSGPIDKWSEAWWASRPPEVRARRCTAHRSDGSNVRCKNVALRMQTVCRYHGGASRNAQAAARRRLGEAQDYLARLLLGLAKSSESEAVKLAAIKHALSLGGTTEKVEVEVEMAPWQGIVTGINFGESRAEARARRGDPPASDDEDVLEAEVIDDDDPGFRPAVRHAAARTGADPHTEVGRILPAGYSAAETFEGYPEGYMPAEVAMERAAQSRRVPDGSSRSRSARFRR